MHFLLQMSPPFISAWRAGIQSLKRQRLDFAQYFQSLNSDHPRERGRQLLHLQTKTLSYRCIPKEHHSDKN
jgi:hypothetical protein